MSLPQKSQIETGVFENFQYHLNVPSQPSKQLLPLVLIFHGTGSNGGDYLKVWKKEADRRKIIILAPTKPPSDGGASIDLEVIYRLIEEVARRYPIDRKRIFLAGNSSGAFIVQRLATDRSTFWKGLIFIASPMAGSWPSSVSKETLPPVLFLHGKKDDQFPVIEIGAVVETLKEKGIDVQYLFDPKEGHTHSPRWNPAIFNWIEKKSSQEKAGTYS